MRYTPSVLLMALGLGSSIFLSSSCTATPHVYPLPTVSSNTDNNADDPTDSFRYYFSVTTDPYERRMGRNWSNQLKFDTDILSRDYVVLYQHLIGNYPKAGPHLAMDEEYMQAHLAKVASDIETMIPDPDFSGVAVLDFEVFRAIWDRTPNKESSEDETALDKDFKDDWRDYVERTNPDFESMNEEEQEAYLCSTYEEGVKKLFLQTLDVCRQLRPNAKWGFYGYPIRFYKNRREAPTNVISYDDGSHNGSRLNDRLQWMWDAVDIVCPSIYAPCVVAGPGDDICDDKYSASEEVEFIENMIKEAQRVANGKPVIPFISVKYNTRHDCLEGQDVADETLYDEIMIPALAGADGAILWGNIENRNDMQHWQWLLDNKIMRLMKRAVDQRRSEDGDQENQARNNSNDKSSSFNSNNALTITTTVRSVKHSANATYSSRSFKSRQYRKARKLLSHIQSGTYRVSKPVVRKSSKKKK